MTEMRRMCPECEKPFQSYMVEGNGQTITRTWSHFFGSCHNKVVEKLSTEKYYTKRASYRKPEKQYFFGMSNSTLKHLMNRGESLK